MIRGGVGRLGAWVKHAWDWLVSLVEFVAELLGDEWKRDVHTSVTYRAVVDAVLPETPALAAELGPEHGPGGVDVDLDDFLVTYIDNAFQFGLDHLGPRGNLPLAEPVANVLDTAALLLLERGEATSEPRSDRAVSLLDPGDAPPRTIREAAGPFAKLSRRDRLRAISLLDEVDPEVTPTEQDLFEFDGGLVGQLVVGFGELIYYSEWQGYDDYSVPPSERVNANDPASVQGWRQTGYPGTANGYAALRGYIGTDDGALGGGETWTTLDDDASSPVRITLESGTFRENEYDTTGYEEPYPE